jgi:hypothetical protein
MRRDGANLASTWGGKKTVPLLFDKATPKYCEAIQQRRKSGINRNWDCVSELGYLLSQFQRMTWT